ncbi:hypothetical protein Tco_0988390 [Tanacetum coccineum]|uniref:Gag-Pol polyprotein n=1 Tax=Tanacetum coccineum TaxID=301880 RepID=A0ABQ5EQU4_9ASTR
MAGKTVPVAEGSSETTTKRYMENYKNVSQDIRDQLNAEAEAVQIILTGIDNDIYSTVDACPNACEMWKAMKVETRSMPSSYFTTTRMASNTPNEVHEILTKRLARTANPLALVAQQQPFYHPPNHPTQNTQYSSIRSGTGYDHQRAVNVAGARENVGTPVVQKSGIQCYNCKEYVQCNGSTYMYIAQLQDVTPYSVTSSGPSFEDDLCIKLLNEIDRLSREYYYADHMNAILGIYTDLDEFTDLQCDYGETLQKCERLEKELSKSRKMSKSFESLQKHAINLN